MRGPLTIYDNMLFIKTASAHNPPRLVVNSRDPVIRTGAAHQPHNANKNMREFPLNTVQTIANQFAAPSRALNSTAGGSNWQQNARLSFIEHQLRLSEAVGTAAELEHWYAVLGAYLAEHGPERRIRLLLDELMGVPPALQNGDCGRSDERKRRRISSGGVREEDRYRGLVRLQLLQRVLDKLQTAPRWQRIYMEYSEQLIERQEASKGIDEKHPPDSAVAMDVGRQT